MGTLNGTTIIFNIVVNYEQSFHDKHILYNNKLNIAHITCIYSDFGIHSC